MSKVGILEFFIMFLFLEFISTLLSMCPRTVWLLCLKRAQPWAHRADSCTWVFGPRKQKRVKSCVGEKGPWSPVLSFQELYSKYKNCIITFKSQNRSRLNGTSADNAKKKPVYLLKSWHTAVCLADQNDHGKPAL